MSAIEWPADVEFRPLQNTLAVEPRDELARTEFDQGPSRARARFTSLIADVSFVTVETQAQQDTFEDFFRTDLANGSKWFRMRLWKRGYVGFEVRITQAFQVNDVQRLVRDLSLNLEVRDWFVKRSDADIFAAHQWVVGQDTDEEVFEIANLLHAFVHETYPSIFPG